ncbi:MAG TPA: chromosome segregation protein SMC [Bryobacteraceae bacterium]|jgi:chromosome segregation protein|nr:chromosome segregation protein SMC [Bryobacteraceae bacterium]
MLKLKKVELQGFKSFCDRTELRFNGGGIAAVVGPNGCGKSNLSDAISWVLGEQSAKSLRGGRMEDVIFAGTKARKPVGMASVTMVLVDPVAQAAPPPAAETEGTVIDEGGEAHKVHEIAHHTPAKPGEITITRRLFRSGESEYLIDGRQARLRDIQDIFMGSGLGPESYAIIEQGRIGQILSSKPQDRRSVIEEAAGITKYKSRRRLAEAKLESSRQNIARVFDILEEVTRQVNSLKRQASKAKRYLELKADLESQLRTVLAGRYMTLKDEAGKASAALEIAQAELKDVTVQAADKDAERQRAQEVFYALEAQLTEARRQRAELNVEAERTRGRLAAQVREVSSIEQRMAGAEQETTTLEARLQQNETDRSADALSVAALEQEMQEVRTGLLEKNQARDAIQLRVREAERTIESSRSVILRLLGEASTFRNQIAQADTYLAGIERERTRVQKEEEIGTTEVKRLTGVKQQLSERIAQRQAELQEVVSSRHEAEASLTAKRQTAAQLRQQIDQIRTEASRLRAKRESVENILSHHSYTTESTKKLLSALENGRAGQFRPEGVLADFVEVDPAWERAAEEHLHDELEYVVVQNWNQAEQSMTLLRGELEGRATFLVEGGPESVDDNSNGPELPRLTDFINFTNGLSGQTRNLLPRLSSCYLATDREQARSMAEAWPDRYFLLPDGQCYNGRMLTGGRKKASGPLVLKREMREYENLLKQQERVLAEKTAEQEALQGESSALEIELERLRLSQQTSEKEAVSLDHESRRASEEINRANSRISIARQELERLKHEEERAHHTRTQNLTLVEQKDADRASREEALEAMREQLDAAQTEAHLIGEEHSVLRAKLAGLEERHRGERAALARLESQFHEMSRRRQQIGTEVQSWGVTRARILSENIELDQKLMALDEQTVAAERQVLELTEAEARHREELTAADEILRGLRARIEAGHTRRSEIEIELTRRQSELQFLDETSRKELNLPVAEIEASGDLSPEVLQATEAAYQETKTKIENLGAVNPTAHEEFEEAQQRFDFLSAQRQDLLDSIRDTEKAIQEIDEYSRTRFTEAFKAINENFKGCFQTLFGGGSGEMHLTDESNINDSGIEIIASPPGKKLQNVLLLSGGEKALTALSLLMAIFKYQPSPFCVLDEVDAPLDEANIGRLTKLLSEMATDTQFIVITHSRKTMESAQAMYGVTMQEAGVSKLVSVKFHHAAA